MADKGKKEEKPKPKAVAINTYARVRCFFPDRESVRLAVKTKSAKETKGKGLLTTLASEEESVRAMTTQFTDVIGSKGTNEQCFKIVCEPIMKSLLEGYKAILIAYGQTGSGKTFTLIGAKGEGQLGLLPRSMEYLLHHDSVQGMRMKAFEAYSTSMGKIPLYDLFEKVNRFQFEPFKATGKNESANKAAEYKWVQRKSQAAQALWHTKVGKTMMDTMHEGVIRDIKTIDDGFNLVEEAHDASHYAKTGKNPESSRGHTVYVVMLDLQNPKGEDFTPIKTEFLVVDLAGSEGGSTLEKLSDGVEKTLRFLEGGTINYGLTSLKDMFSELRRKGKLKPTQGLGLRKLLYPFCTTNTMMSIIFTLSPSWDNVMPTRATMKFAQDACKLKMKPVADVGSKNYEKMYAKMKDTLQEKLDLIEQLQKTIDEGIDHAQAAVTDVDEVMAEILGTIYQERQDKVYQLFQDYNLTQYLDEAVSEDVEKEMADRRSEYAEKLRHIFKKHDPDNLGHAEDILDKWMRRGVGYHAGYAFLCEKYHIKADRDVLKNSHDQRESRGTSLNVAATAGHARRRTGLWLENAKLITSKADFQMEQHKNDIADMETFLMGIDEEHSDGHSDDEDEIVIQPHAHAFEEIEDMAVQKPSFFDEFDNRMQMELEDAFSNPSNVQHGVMTPHFREEVKEDYDLTDAQLDQLHDYQLAKRVNTEQEKAIESFKAALGKGGDEAMDEDLGLLLAYQNKIHQLENKIRVEKSLKLWGQMRLKIRDRKLKAREEQVTELERQVTTLEAKKDAGEELLQKLTTARTGEAGQLDNKLDKLLQKVESFHHTTDLGMVSSSNLEPDAAEAEVEIRHLREDLFAAEEKIEQLELIQESVEDKNMKELLGHMGEINNKVSHLKVEKFRLEGRLDEMRHALGDQHEVINSLRKQIFIILTYPKVITIEGRVGYNSTMNGLYHVGTHLHSGRVFYRHQDSSWVLRWFTPKGLWILDNRGLNNDTTGSGCVHEDVDHPMLITKQWLIFGGEEEGFAVDSSVRISGELLHKAEEKRGPGMK